MKTKLFALGATLVLAAGVTVAQPTITQSLILAGSNTTHRLTLTVPTLTGSRTVTIPDVSTNAFVMLTEGAQTANGALTLTAPLTLNGTSEIRFNNGTNTFYSSFKAAAGQGANITYTLPSTAPAAGQVLTAGTSNPTELTWANPTSGGGGGSNVQFVALASESQNSSNSSWTSVTGMNVNIDAGKAYYLTAVFRIRRVTGSNDVNLGWEATENDVSNTWYFSVITNEDVDDTENTGDMTMTSAPQIDTEGSTVVVEVKGLVIGGSNNAILRPRFKRANGSGSNTVAIMANSVIKVESAN